MEPNLKKGYPENCFGEKGTSKDCFCKKDTAGLPLTTAFGKRYSGDSPKVTPMLALESQFATCKKLVKVVHLLFLSIFSVCSS